MAQTKTKAQIEKEIAEVKAIQDQLQEEKREADRKASVHLLAWYIALTVPCTLYGSARRMRTGHTGC